MDVQASPLAQADRRTARSSTLARWQFALRRRPELALIPVTFILFLTTWELLISLLRVPTYVAPAPSSVVAALGRLLASGLLAQHALVTLGEVLAGFSIALVLALLIGTLIAEFVLVDRVFYPYLVALQTLPKVAIAPLIVIWFGYDVGSKIVLSALLSFFPMLVNTIQGYKSNDDQRLRLLRVLDASRWQTLYLLKIPSALPFILAGVELGIIYAMLGAIVGEFVGSSKGIGHFLIQMNFQLDTAGSFAILALLATYGICVQLVLRFLRRKLLFWLQNDTRLQGEG